MTMRDIVCVALGAIGYALIMTAVDWFCALRELTRKN